MIRDEDIMLASEKDRDYGMRLRRVEVWVEAKQCTLAFVTNHLKLAATTNRGDLQRPKGDIPIRARGLTSATPSPSLVRRRVYIGVEP